MALPITGATIDMGDDTPLVDVDSTLLDLHEELRQRRPRQFAALGYAINRLWDAERLQSAQTPATEEELAEGNGTPETPAIPKQGKR